MRTQSRILTASLVLLVIAGCNCGNPNPGVGFDGGEEADGGGGGTEDGGGGGDGGANDDGGAIDDGGTNDGGQTDAGFDAGVGGPCTMDVSCYTGPANTSGVGVCHAGVQQCVNGVLGPCIGQVTPSAEACNGLDDDCDGTTDNAATLGQVTCGIGACAVTVNACTNGKATACTAGTPMQESCGNNIDDDCDGVIDDGCACIYVFGTTGLDTNSGAAATPMKTITAAIAKASQQGMPKQVCVASGATAPSSLDYTENVAMVNGVQVLGGFVVSGTTTNWQRNAQATTRILPQTAAGVTFDATITSPTALDGFTIVAHDDPTSAAVTIHGSSGAIVSNDVITGNLSAAAQTSIGVDIDDTGGTATPQILRNAITGGNGTQAAIGVRSTRAAPLIQNQCSTFDAAGRCTSNGCFNSTRFIRGRQMTNSGLVSVGVLLDGSKNAIVEDNGICAFQANDESYAVRIVNDATGVQVRGNNLAANQASKFSIGVLAEPCAGASPWIFDNTGISGRSSTVGATGEGIRAIGDCPVRVDSNALIVGGVEASQSDTAGVSCRPDPTTGAPNLCTVLGNEAIQGSGSGFPPNSVGVRCEKGSCARIEDNRSITGQSGLNSIGLWLDGSSVFVDRNVISAGCANGQTATSFGIGLRADDALARVENNFITGSAPTASCAGNAPNSYGVLITAGNSLNEVDLNGNTINARGRAMGCTSHAIAFDVASTGGPMGARGIVRNDILLAGNCPTSISIDELNAGADPRFVQNNDLFGTVNGFTLYRDEAMTNLTSTMAVNALTDTTAAANVSADPLFVGAANPHISAMSVCRNAGTSLGAPTADIDGNPRPTESAVDIGFDEYVP